MNESKAEMLAYLAAEVEQCQQCRVLSSSRKKTVFGRGNPEAVLVFVGEAPGADEDEKGLPFVGKCGQLLDNILASFKIPQEEVYIMNVVKCRPPQNRLPDDGEISRCGKFFELQLKVLDPMFIVCLGTVAAHRLFGKGESIGNMRGQMRPFRQWGLNATALCTYHPSYLLRNQEAKKLVADDMRLLLSTMKSGLQT